MRFAKKRIPVEKHAKEKIQISMVVLGHVDSGKSTTTGHLTRSLVIVISVSSRGLKKKKMT